MIIDHIAVFKSGSSVYVSDVVAWSLDILIGQAAPINQLKCQATRLARQRRKQMHPTQDLTKFGDSSKELDSK